MWIRLASLLLVLAIFVGGCTKLPEEYPTPTPLATPSANNKPVYPVVRGDVIQTVKSLGRVAAADESVLYFKQSGRLHQIYVNTNDKVKKGQLLAELETGHLHEQIDQAQTSVDIAQLKLDQVMEKATGGGESPDVAAARSAVASAEANAAKAQATLATLQSSPTAADVEAAQAAVTLARSQESQAKANLTKLTAPLTADQITVLKAAVDKARAAVAQAQAAYDKVKWRPNIAALPQSATLQEMTTNYQSAEAAYNVATAGPKPEDIAAGKQAITSAQAAVTSATAKLALVKQGPTTADVRAAQAAITSANAAVTAARQAYDAKLANVSGKSLDVEIARKEVDLAKSSLAILQKDLSDAEIVAPFTGVILETDGNPGDLINSYTPVVTVANPTNLQLAVELQPSDLSQVALGQAATIVMTQYPTAQLQSKVVRMPSIATGNEPQLPASLRTVRIALPSPLPGPVALGDLANVTIATQEKRNVLLIPNTVVRSFGGRRFVRIEGPNGRILEVDIEVGISDDTNTEVLKGLKEGDKVISP